MWRRIKRVVEANLGRFLDDPLAADPAALAAQIEAVRGQIALLERDLARADAEADALGETIRAELAAGRRDAGLELAKRLGEIRDGRARLERQLEVARRACARAEAVRQAHGPRVVADAELTAAADQTLARLERDLAVEGAPAAEPEGLSGERAKAPGDPEKTLGGASERADPTDPVRLAARKTIGPEPIAAARTPDLVGELERLARLRDSGALSPEEFEQAKRRMLGG